jgi:hypothetical protein
VKLLKIRKRMEKMYSVGREFNSGYHREFLFSLECNKKVTNDA